MSSEPKKQQRHAIDLINELIADLEAKLGLKPGECISLKDQQLDADNNNNNNNNNQSPLGNKTNKLNIAATANDDKTADNSNSNNNDDAVICKLEVKVGKIIKVWIHPEADKLYCEEIDVGDSIPRQIVSGLRAHYSLEEMLGRNILVITNLKAKKLAGLVSSGMVLCAASPTDDKVEFVEPPEGAHIGEVVYFEGLPKPIPISAAQMDKKKIFQQCMVDMKTTDECIATWKGHAFLTSMGPCKSATVRGGEIR